MSSLRPLNLKRLIQFAELAGRDTTPDGEALNAMRALRKALDAGGTSLAEMLAAPGTGSNSLDAGEAAALRRQLATADATIARLEADHTRQKMRITRLELAQTKLKDRIEELEAQPPGATAAANAARRQIADEHARAVASVLAGLGNISMDEAAAALNARRIPAARGGKWSARQVRRVMDRVQPPAKARRR